MKQEDKELLLKDLCARLPYGVILYVDGINTNRTLFGVYQNREHPNSVDIGGGIAAIEVVKPYLRPMSSMTEEEKKEFLKLADGDENDFEDIIKYPNAYSLTISIEAFDWLYKHNIDFRRLIKKGLALEAPEGMYNIKD